MSVGPGPHPALVQGNQSTLGPDPSQHSALFYLFQEVSKLPSLIHNTVVGTDPPCPWLKDASLQGCFNAGIKGREMRSSEISDHSGSPHETNVTDQSQDSKTTPESHSPWRVLSLINLQCKRLLHHSDAEEYGPNSSLSSSTLTIDRLTKTAAKVTDQEVGSDRSSSAFSFRPSVLQCQKEEIASRVSAGEAIIGTGVGSNPQVCETESREDSGQLESTGEPQTGKDSSHFHHKEDKEDKFSTNRQSGWNGEQVEEYVSSEEGSERLTSENISKKPKPTPPEFLHDHLAFGSNVEAVIFLMKPEFTLDRNANVSLPIEAARDPRLQSLHASQPSSPSAAHHPRLIPEQGHPPVGQSGSPQEVTGSLPVQQIRDTPTNPSKRGESKPDPGPAQKKDAAGAGSQPWRTRASRKQPHPIRSVDIHDPHLQGVMFRMDPELDDSKEQCRLLITSEYRGCYNPLGTHGPGPSKRVRKPRPRIRTAQRSVTTSSSDDEASGVSKDKMCASCCTRKTPMWRNAEDGTALCNACGIRYKKYKVRCVNCWHIPRKESNSNSTCLKCGNFVRLTSAQLKHTT